MSDLKTLTLRVKELKTSLKKLKEEQDNTCAVSFAERARFNQLKDEVGVATNQLHDAVGDLSDYIRAETGMYASEFPDMLRDSGYVISKTVPLPRRIAESFGE